MSDLINREQAMESVARHYHQETGCEGGWFAYKAIADVPSADRPQGEWIRRLVDNGFNADWVCSECGYRVKTDFVSFNFCPNCGADMRKGADDETD